jgi:hypothetical protein
MATSLDETTKKIDMYWLDYCQPGSSCATLMARGWCRFPSVPWVVSARQIHESREPLTQTGPGRLRNALRRVTHAVSQRTFETMFGIESILWQYICIYT